MAYLIDSDVMVDFTRGNAKAADYLDSLDDDCLLSAITALELIAGARNQREVTDLDILISAYEQIPPNEEIARRAYSLTMTFARAHGLHALDALIAATAIENGFTLVSKNRKHFQMIGALDLEVPNYWVPTPAIGAPSRSTVAPAPGPRPPSTRTPAPPACPK